MGRNIVVCCDGTNNQFGVCNTNVVRLLQVAVQQTADQIAYYDPGVGTLPEHGFISREGKAISRGIKQAFAADIEGKVGTAYAHLMERGLKHVYVDGGVTIQRFIECGLIHRLMVTRVPVLIGSGIPLFGRLTRHIHLVHVRTSDFAGGLVQSEYAFG